MRHRQPLPPPFPPNFFRLTLNLCIKFWNFKNFLFSRIFWLTDQLLRSDKHNSIMAIAICLISLLLNVALSGDVPFCQLQQLQCLHHDSTKSLKLSFVLLCAPFLSPLPLRWQFAVHALRLQCEDFGKCSASRGASYIILYLECYPNCSKNWKQNQA